MAGIEILGLDHVDLSVSDRDRAVAFYQAVLPALGFRRLPDDADCALWRGPGLEIGIRAATPAQPGGPADRSRPGLHHLAFRARRRQDVDRLHELLVGQGAEILDPPADYPGYGPQYYAVFFADPDGIKLELVYRGPPD